MALTALALLTACEPKREEPDPSLILSARKAALDFDIRLRREILDRLERDEDPVAVYLAYADNVPGWGREISDTSKVDLSRTALGVRNPADAPDTWEQQQMLTFNFLLETGLDPTTFESSEIVVENGQKVFRWLRPVVMVEQCLVCHGENLSARIKLLLGQEYPLDEAAGYSEGALGGAYSVRIPLKPDGKPAPYILAPIAPPAPADAPSSAAQPDPPPPIELQPDLPPFEPDPL